MSDISDDNTGSFSTDAFKQANALLSDYMEAPGVAKAPQLHQAISLYEAVLRVKTEQTFPMEWAETKCNLGVAYWNLPMGDRGTSLTRAIACYEAALRVITEQAFPADWALTQFRLGNAYQLLPRGDREANLKRSIACYEAVLRVRTEPAFPADWAMTLHNLGNVHQLFPTGDREANLRRAIACYEAALRVRTEQAFPAEWANIQNNLGIAYWNLLTGDREANLTRAIACYEAALRVRTEQTFPAEWAGTQNNLGLTYAAFPTGDQGTNLERAIACYEATLRVKTEQAFPLDWAGTQHNLGVAYWNLPTGDQGANLKRAIACHEAVLRIFTQEAFPHVRLRTLSNLVSLNLQKSDWQESLTLCQDGIQTIEGLRTTALTAAERTRLLTTGLAFFDRAVLCCYKLQQYEQALVYAERGKTRNLVDSLATQAAQPRQAPQESWSRYKQCLTESHNLEQQLADHSRASGDVMMPTVLLQERVADLRAQQRRMEAEFHRLDRDFLPTIPPLSFQDIQAIVAKSEAILVEFRVTEEGTFVFLLGPQERTLEEAQVLYSPDFTEIRLQEIMVRFEEEEAVGGWLFQYDDLQRRPNSATLAAWQDCIEEVTADLYALLMRPVRQRLQARYPDVKKLILVPNKLLTLLPLHAVHWQHEGERHYFLDEYEIQYAPSCTVLRICQDRARKKRRPVSLFAVQNPATDLPDWPDLPYTDWEVVEAGRHFTDKRILSRKAATLGSVRQYIGEGEEVFFSCHGSFDPVNPSESHFVLTAGERLSLSEILQMDLSQASLAILSACETALSDYGDTTDEAQGLHTAFLLARVPTVIGGVWSVDDLSTAFLMVRFHENLYTTSMGYARALQEAQRWVRDLSRQEAEALLIGALSLEKAQRSAARFTLRDLASSPEEKPFAHPYWWAAFQCLGVGRLVE